MHTLYHALFSQTIHCRVCVTILLDPLCRYGYKQNGWVSQREYMVGFHDGKFIACFHVGEYMVVHGWVS